MPGVPTYIITAVGSIVLICIALCALYSLLWVVLYSIGRTIFHVRASGPEWQKKPLHKKLRDVLRDLWRGILEGASFPASGIQCGNLSWKPLFQYDGFRRAAQKGQP